MFISLPLFSQEFVIETSRGNQRLVIPEGASLEEAYKVLAVLYLEERWDHEDTILELEKLLSKSNDLLRDIERYKNKNEIVHQEKDILINMLELNSKKLLLRPFFSLGIGRFFENEFVKYYGSVSAGGFWLDKITTSIEMRYPLQVGLSIGIIF